MSIFGTKRTRGGRAALQLSTGRVQDLLRNLRDQAVLTRLALCLLTIAGMVVAVQGWKKPFRFRLDQRPVDGIAAAIDFHRVNRERTARAKDRAAEQVPPVFRNEPRAVVKLPQDLRAALQPFVTANTLQQLPAETRRIFGLTVAADTTPVPAAAVVPADRTESFARLKALATDEKLQRDVLAEFSKFIQPLEKNGVVRVEHFPQDIVIAGQIAVNEPDGSHRLVNLSEVQLAELLAPTGLLFGRWALFPSLIPLRGELEYWLNNQALETLFFDGAATQAARQKARNDEPDSRDVYNAGNLLVKPGEVIDEVKLELLYAEYEQMEAESTPGDRLVRVATVFLLLLVLAVLNGYYIVRNEPKLVWNFGQLSLYLGLLVLTVAVGRVLSYDPWRAGIGPVLAAVMILAIAYNQVLAALTAFSLSIILTLSTGGDLGRFVTLMSVCGTAAILLSSVSTRSTLVLVGAWSAAASFLTFWGVTIIEQPVGHAVFRDPTNWFHSLRSVGWCLAAGFLVSGSLPFIEALFGAVTDISLLELGDVSHPLLQELVRRAPGTYNHSITVASIGETAADSIGANGLLVRVGAYFHDIGKMLKPQYFVENTVAGENRHENLNPTMSTLIIIGHVKDGADLARQHNLPDPLIDFIEQHHGTTLVEFFYHEATRLAEQDPGHRTDAEESSFRYPGPKPQTREAAVLMIADAVEGATRTLSEPTSKRIERLVHEISMKRLLDGQFDECGLTLTQLAQVEDSLTKSLTAMYHSRVKYPEQRTA
jgi:cyclic-di-AMP phosphodiesterase PgpH